MNSNQKNGIGFIIGGVLSIIIIPRILSLMGLYMIDYYLQSYYIIYIIALILIGLGIKSLVSNSTNRGEEEVYSIPSDSNQSISNSYNTNKVVNITLTGGIIGLIGDSPQNALNRRIRKENANGWKVIQIIPSASGNILLIILRLLILICTLFFYTTANGYYVIMEKKE